MSTFHVSVTCDTNGRTLALPHGTTILGRSNKDLGLDAFRSLSKQQLQIVVDARARTVTAERLGTNASYLNSRPLPKGTVTQLKNKDEINLVTNLHLCRFAIVETLFSTLPSSPPKYGDDFSRQNSLLVDDKGGDDERLERIEEEERLPHDDDDDESDRGGAGQYKGPMWPEDFSDESDDVIGSGIDDWSQDEKSEGNKREEATASPRGVKRSAENSPAQLPRAKKKLTRAPPVKMETVSVKSGERRVTGYGVFAKKMRAELKREYPDHPSTVITKMLKRRWAELNDAEREAANVEADEHNAALESDSLTATSSKTQQRNARAASTPAASPSPPPNQPSPRPGATIPVHSDVSDVAEPMNHGLPLLYSSPHKMVLDEPQHPASSQAGGSHDTLPALYRKGTGRSVEASSLFGMSDSGSDTA
ncbi:hypothetical protein HKX48_000667 [Thoreauomyces humboldtii]|nr:hypothetical protein HKX48_000667 [Thoreauomyces humboldtii]